MARPVSPETREAVYASQTDKIWLYLVEISSSEFTPVLGTDTLYFVQNNENIVHQSNTYIAVNFSVTSPIQEDGSIQDTSLTISAIDRTVVEAIRSINNAPDIKLFMVRTDDPDTVEVGPWDFKLRQVSYDVKSITGTLMIDSPLDRKASTITVSPFTFPSAYD